ncbi:MAG: phage tail assembly protein [Treponema sp.]|nr:phage tail assembly protein [Treponema sp.]
MFTGTVTVKLSTPAKWEGEEISSLVLDFGKVNGAMINTCERETFGGGNISGINRPTSSEYCARLAAAISGKPFRLIEKMPFGDYETIWQTVSAFIMHRNPQEFYNQFTEGDEEKKDFTSPAATAKPEAEKPKAEPK